MSHCTVVMYHYVRDAAATGFPDLKVLPVAEFEAQLDWLQSQCRLLDYAGFEAVLDGQRPADQPSALLTFDDGFVDHYEIVWPILKRRGLSGVFFIAGAPTQDPPAMLNVHRTHFLLARLGAAAFTRQLIEAVARQSGAEGPSLVARDGVYRYDEMDDKDVKHWLNYELPFPVADAALEALFVEHLGQSSAFARALYLREGMIREMAAAGQTFGWHTQSHRVLSRLAPDEQDRELADGVDTMRRLTGQARVPFCYPYGHAHTYTQHTVGALQRFGYSAAFTVVRKTVRFDRDHGRPFELPRLDCKDLPPFRSAKELSAYA